MIMNKILIPIFHLLAFSLEVGMLWAIGYWGFHTDEVYTKLIFGVGIPVLVAIFWGMVMAPKAQRRLRQPLRLLVGVGLFSFGAWALYAAQQPNWGLAFLIAIAVYAVLNTVLYKELDKESRNSN